MPEGLPVCWGIRTPVLVPAQQALFPLSDSQTLASAVSLLLLYVEMRKVKTGKLGILLKVTQVIGITYKVQIHHKTASYLLKHCITLCLSIPHQTYRAHMPYTS